MKKVKQKSYDSAISSPMGKEAKNRRVYPTIRIDHSHLPDAKDWGVGEHHHVHMNVKMVGNSQSRFQNEGEYEMHGIDHCDEGHDGEHHEHTLAGEENSKKDKEDLEDDNQEELDEKKEDKE